MSDLWFPKNRGKVRGWPRRLRQIEALRTRYALPDDAALDGWGYDTAELHLAPWGNLVRRPPPPWLFRALLDVLLDLQRRWQAHLAARAARIGEPVDVMLWLVHPRANGTQLVAAVGDRVPFYHGTFLEPRTDVPPRPPALHPGLDAPDWTPGVDVDWVDQGSLDEDSEYRAWFERRRRAHVVNEGHGMLAVRRGGAWIGRIPGGD